MAARRFRGESVHKVDAKGRVSIPAAFRRVLEDGDPDWTVVLDDPPAKPLEWLARGVDDIVMGLARGQDLDLRLAVVERRIAQRRRLGQEGRDILRARVDRG